MNRMVEKKLRQAAAVKVTHVDLWDDINQQLKKDQKLNRQPRRTGWVLKTSLGTAAIILLIMIFSPQARALAQDIIHQIGNIKFVNQSSEYADPDHAESRATPNADELAEMPLLDREAWEKHKLIFSDGVSEEYKKEVLATQAVNPETAAEAEESLEMDLLQFTYLPPGFVFSKNESHESEYGVKSNYTIYAKHDQNGELISGLLLNQVYMPGGVPEQFGTWNVGEKALISDTTVRGLPAKYVRGADIAIIPQDILSWQEGNIDFSLIVTGGTLSLDELQQIAAGLE